jgi:hypothetical protein
MIPTADPDVFIEEQRDGYVRYQRKDGLRWIVLGTCDRRGDCMIGAVVETPDGPVEIKNHEQLGSLEIGDELDVPVYIGFNGCCPLQVVLINAAD